MEYRTIILKDINYKTPNRYYYITLKDKIYRFDVRWNKYGKYAILSIYNSENQAIITGRAMTNGLKIRNNKLPYVMYFLQKDGKTYEPDLDCFSSDFVLVCGEEING